MNDCLFCKIADKRVAAVVLCEDTDLIAFLDIAPIRTGHTQIMPKKHYETFELVPQELATRMMVMGQDLAKRLKATYNVERVAFLITGGDVPHAHAHVVPMHEKTDITSARYILNSEDLRWGSAHLLSGQESLLQVKEELGFGA